MWVKCNKDHYFNPDLKDIRFFKNPPPIGFKMLSEGKLYKFVKYDKRRKNYIFVITDFDDKPRIYDRNVFDMVTPDEWREQQLNELLDESK